MRSQSPVHIIKIKSLDYFMLNDWGWVLEDFEYELDHGACERRDYECPVQETINEGLHEALVGTWNRKDKIEIRDYRVIAWWAKYDTIDGIEYDAGLEEVE